MSGIEADTYFFLIGKSEFSNSNLKGRKHIFETFKRNALSYKSF